jgi:YHS domain-containing protein
MFTRFLLWALFVLVVSRAIGRIMRGIAEGASGSAPSGRNRGRARPATPEPTKGELMVRDPVCGTFVVPSRALSARGAGGTVYFCSEKCRETHASH